MLLIDLDAAALERGTAAIEKSLARMVKKERATAEEARAIGLINEVVEPEEVLPRARAIAQRLASFDPAAVQTAKRTLRQSWGLPEEEACRIQQQSYDDFMAARA